MPCSGNLVRFAFPNLIQPRLSRSTAEWSVGNLRPTPSACDHFDCLNSFTLRVGRIGVVEIVPPSNTVGSAGFTMLGLVV